MTQWGEESLMPASSGNFVAPCGALAVAGMMGLWRLTGRGRMKWVDRNRREMERDGRRGRDTWSEEQSEGGGGERERNRERGTSGGRGRRGRD